MKYIIILVFSFLIGSCGAGNKAKETVNKAIHEKWELSIINGKPITGNQPIFIELTEEGKVNGFSGCNRLAGSYSIENESQIRFTHLVSTRMACQNEDMELETQVLQVLNTTDNFTVNDGKLMLNIGRRAPLAEFHKMSDNEIVNKYWKLIKLEGKNVQMSPSQKQEQYFKLRSDGTVAGFSGCNQFNGQYELAKGDRINFKESMAVTMRACLDDNNTESNFLKVFELTDNYSISGDTLSLNVGKKAPLAIFEAVYF